MLYLAASEVKAELSCLSAQTKLMPFGYKQRLGPYMECALTEPVVIEKSGRPAVVMLSIAEYERLQALDDAYWGERAKQALEGGLAGTDETCADYRNVSMLRLNLTDAALPLLEDLPDKQLVNTVFNLLKNPTSQDSGLLKGYPYRRVDLGEYRIVYQVQGEALQVLVIGKRNDDDVYKKLSCLAR